MPKNIETMFNDMVNSRSVVYNKAVEASRLTIPSLFLQEGHTELSPLPQPWQSLGARGVSNLASKLGSSLLPPGRPFMEFALNLPFAQGADPNAIIAATAVLNLLGRMVQSRIEATNYRTVIDTALQHAIVGGNANIYVNPDMEFSVYNLADYVIRRTPSGKLMLIICRDWYAWLDLEPEWQSKLRREKPTDELEQYTDKNKLIPVYTSIRRTTEKWEITREACGITLDDSQSFGFKSKLLSYIPFRWKAINNEDYGRGYCEELAGDLNAFNGLSRSIRRGAAATSRIIPLISPAGVTDIDDLNDAREDDGKWIPGDPKDLGFVGAGRSIDLTWAVAHHGQLRDSLNRAFLLGMDDLSGRDRVTAAEIMARQREIMETFSGTTSILGAELQRPLAEVIIDKMKLNGELPKELEYGSGKPIQIKIKAGIDTLGNSQELLRISQLIELEGVMRQSNPSEPSRLNVGTILSLASNYLGLDARQVIVSEEQLRATMQQAQQAALSQQAGEKAIEVAGDNFKNTRK